MDKFGIFELLDTLSQIASEVQGDETPPAYSESQPTSGDSSAPSPRPAPVTRVNADDKSFLPPDFNGATSDEAKPSRNALNSLYERHESISKRIDKNK